VNNLPASVQQMIDLLGVGPALALVRSFGGHVIKVPSRDRRDGRLRERLIEVMGEAPALLFIDHFSGETISIARCAAAARDERDLRIIAAYDAGKKVADLASEHVLTERQIWTILKRVPGEAVGGLGQTPQLGLF
jgi:hypothetical protein